MGRNLRSLTTGLALGSLGALGLAGTAHADIVHLTNGNKLEGQVERFEDQVRLTTVYGTAMLEASQVARIEKKAHVLDEYQNRRTQVKHNDAAGHFALAQWCLKQGMKRQALAHAEITVDLEHHHVGARRLLDHTLLDGRWVPRAEALRAQGLLQYRGKWMSRAEAEKAHAADLEANKRIRLQALVSHITRTMSGADAKGRKLCYEELMRLAKEHEVPGLTDSAKKVYNFYEKRARQQVKAASGGGSLGGVVLTELRLTNAQLVRPIPQLQTNLGQAGSTPVTIQLPELQVIGVETTVAIPFGLPK
jgi:hypothetical protein